MRTELVALLNRVRSRLRSIPQAYTVGPLLFALAAGFLVASLTVQTGIVGEGFALRDAPPGIAEFEVPFRLNLPFRATYLTGDCGIKVYLLSDSEYTKFQANGSLPTFTLDCMRKEAEVQGPVGQMVTNYSAPPSAPNATFSISAVFLGPQAPYALLSIPGAGLALGVTIWIAMTTLSRGTDRLVEEARLRYQKRMKK